MFSRSFVENLRRFDWPLLAAALCLVLFGLAGIGSVGLSKEPADFLFLRKQIVFSAAGFALMGLAAFTHPTRWRFASTAIYILSVLALAAVLVFGETIRGTTGWFSIGGFSIQPVEAVKFALLLVLAKFVAEHIFLARQWKLFWTTGLFLAPPLFFVLAQPDAGSASVLVVLWFGILFAAGIRRSHFLILIMAAAATAVAVWFFALAPYQKDRILTFLHPERDPLGSGYNVTQSIIAVGSGKLFGRGLGFGAQSQMKFLPEAQTDFIFAVLAEELGFAGVLVILIAYGLFFWRTIKIAKRVSDPYSQFVVLGVLVIIFYEVFVNLGMNIGIVPVTGITLPFVSYGGSSLVAHLIMLGLLQGIAMYGARRAEMG